MLLVDLIGIQMDPFTGASILVLREHDAPNRLMPIIVGGAEAASIAIAASGQTFPRPMTHDLMATLVESFDGHIDAVEVTDLQDGSLLASLAISGPIGERRLDTRPSDAIALAVRLHTPMYVSEHVLDQVGTFAPIESDADTPDADTPDAETLDGQTFDAETIDAAVDEFRNFLAELDPADFDTEAPTDGEFDPADFDTEAPTDGEPGPADFDTEAPTDGEPED